MRSASSRRSSTTWFVGDRDEVIDHPFQHVELYGRGRRSRRRRPRGPCPRSCVTWLVLTACFGSALFVALPGLHGLGGAVGEVILPKIGPLLPRILVTFGPLPPGLAGSWPSTLASLASVFDRLSSRMLPVRRFPAAVQVNSTVFDSCWLVGLRTVTLSVPAAPGSAERGGQLGGRHVHRRHLHLIDLDHAVVAEVGPGHRHRGLATDDGSVGCKRRDRSGRGAPASHRSVTHPAR